jgi:hypothetical protein
VCAVVLRYMLKEAVRLSFAGTAYSVCQKQPRRSLEPEPSSLVPHTNEAKGMRQTRQVANQRREIGVCGRLESQVMLHQPTSFACDRAGSRESAPEESCTMMRNHYPHCCDSRRRARRPDRSCGVFRSCGGRSCYSCFCCRHDCLAPVMIPHQQSKTQVCGRDKMKQGKARGPPRYKQSNMLHCCE